VNLPALAGPPSSGGVGWCETPLERLALICYYGLGWGGVRFAEAISATRGLRSASRHHDNFLCLGHRSSTSVGALSRGFCGFHPWLGSIFLQYGILFWRSHGRFLYSTRFLLLLGPRSLCASRTAFQYWAAQCELGGVSKNETLMPPLLLMLSVRLPRRQLPARSRHSPLCGMFGP
jgi:hypothetical protein